MKLKVKKVLDLLKGKSSSKDNVKVHRLSYVTNSSFDGNNYIDRWCKIRNSHFGMYSYVGFRGDFNNIEIGNYCSISSDVKIGLGKHPTHLFSSSPVFYSNNNPFNTKKAYLQFNDNPEKTTIGNDVWIGANVIVMDGVKIGTRAIREVGSVVTKDVQPYEIVGGVPAKPIKKRFDDEIIKALLDSEWWKLTPEQLKQKKFSIKHLYIES